ncbi:MAG TPA: amidohydrolase family protein, partial [Caulobacteraceae bacterium]|nr:amidohydrolase family protein [Caulobacteraceae bacterium]
PGLIDLHTHLLLHPYDETPWNDQVLKEPLELRTLRAVGAARATLAAGFTTVRELGTEGAGFADVALRDAIAMHWIAGPRIFASTRAIVASGSYGPEGFDPRWDVPKGAQVADGVDGMRRAVREQIAAGADWIKVYADYARRPGAPSTPTFSQDELAAAVDEARSAGLPVAAHAHTAEGIRRAVLAGVTTIEHGTGATAEVLELMRRRGVALCPTLAAAEAVTRYAGWRPGQPEPARLVEARAGFARALAAKVLIANGSDAGVFAHGENARELELLVAWGMTPRDALRAATATAAAVLGRGRDLGRVAPGAIADLVAFAGDPLAGIAALRHPVLVIKDGRIEIDRRAAP